jgi:hypothetical protein
MFRGSSTMKTCLISGLKSEERRRDQHVLRVRRIQMASLQNPPDVVAEAKERLLDDDGFKN